MRSIYKRVLLLVIMGVALFWAAQGIIMPKVVQSRQQSIEKQKDPLTHDFESISKYKSKYMGDAPNLINLFYSLPLNDLELTFQLFPEAFAADVNYKEAIDYIDEDRLNMSLIYNATAAFALIDNLETVRFNFKGSSYKVLRADVEEWYGVELHTLTEKNAWKNTVQSRLGDDNYVQSCIKAIISKEEARTPVEQAIMSYYENTDEAVIIYEQIPFEEGTLVLAEKLSDGEHYPDLHFVDDKNAVTYLTRGSYCWTLNYTQFRGYYIYFGLAGVETRQYTDNPIPVEKVEALFSDKTVSVIPRESIIAHINLMDRDSRFFKNPQGYIMPVKGRDMPYDFTAILENGEKLSLSKKVIEGGIDNMPEYLKSKKAEVYNSFTFTYTSMLTPEEWYKGYKEGEICLEGKTDHRGNRNARHLRPAGHMSFADSFILPQDIKPFYLSDNYVRTTVFSAGETVAVKYPGERKLLDCRILRLTREKVEKEIGQDDFAVVEINKKGQVTLPKEKGYYLFLLRTVEDKEVQTYTGMFTIKQD